MRHSHAYKSHLHLTAQSYLLICLHLLHHSTEPFLTSNTLAHHTHNLHARTHTPTRPPPPTHTHAHTHSTHAAIGRRGNLAGQVTSSWRLQLLYCLFSSLGARVDMSTKRTNKQQLLLPLQEHVLICPSVGTTKQLATAAARAHDVVSAPPCAA